MTDLSTHLRAEVLPDGDYEPVALTVDGLDKVFSAHDKKRFMRAGHGVGTHAVQDVSFAVLPGQLFTLLGPSGCGKTTTLRSIAGLETPDGGVIAMGDKDLFNAQRRVNVPTEQRGLGMVFQSYAIWPHMTVFENVAFPLRMGPRRGRVSGDALRMRVHKTLDSVGLDHLAQRFATALSGGQQQRLALARGLVVEPRLLLLDEPLSNLDAKLRESMRLELKRMQVELGVTSIYVTHDQEEALAMSDVVAVMNAGAIMQIGTPTEIYQRPTSRFVAEFIGTCNLFEGTVAAKSAEGVAFDVAGARLRTADRSTVDVGESVLATARPEDLRMSVAEQRPGGPNTWAGTVVTRAFLGESTTYVVRTGATTMQCKADPMSGITIGEEVWLSVAPERLRLITESIGQEP